MGTADLRKLGLRKLGYVQVNVHSAWYPSVKDGLPPDPRPAAAGGWTVGSREELATAIPLTLKRWAMSSGSLTSGRDVQKTSPLVDVTCPAKNVNDSTQSL